MQFLCALTCTVNDPKKRSIASTQKCNFANLDLDLAQVQVPTRGTKAYGTMVGDTKKTVHPLSLTKSQSQLLVLLGAPLVLSGTQI